MTRIVLGLVVLALLAACTSGGGSGAAEGSDDGADARSMKAEMDREAEAVLPDLVGKVGGRLDGMQATFYERGGFGIWDYTADGALVQPSGTMSDSLTAVRAVLEEHGFSVESDDARKRVTGTKGHVSVIVEASLLSAEKKGAGLNVSIGIIGGIQHGDDFAASAPPEDYLAYLD